MRDLLCLLPNTRISVGLWAPHPCGGYYEHERWCYGPHGRIGYDMTGAPSDAVGLEEGDSMTQPRQTRRLWPHESCLDCRLRMPNSEAADAHQRLTGHLLGWPIDEDANDYPLATEKQIHAS